jgi:hypothetical protein
VLFTGPLVDLFFVVVVVVVGLLIRVLLWNLKIVFNPIICCPLTCSLLLPSVSKEDIMHSGLY